MATLKELKQERRLVKYAVKGDKRSLERLIVSYINFCYSIALIFLEDDKLAKKAVETTLEQVYIKIEELYNPKGFKVWVYDILKKSIDKLKQKGELVDTGHGALEQNKIDYLTLYKIDYSEVEETEKLLELIRDLPDEEKEVLVLIDFEGLSCNDTALLLDTDIMTVRQRLYNAKLHLKQIFMFKAKKIEKQIKEQIKEKKLDDNLEDSEKGQVYGIDQYGV